MTSATVSIDDIALGVSEGFDSGIAIVTRDVLTPLLNRAQSVLEQKGLDVNAGLQQLAANYMEAYHTILGFSNGRPHSYTAQEKMQIARALAEFYQEQLEGPLTRGEVTPRLAGKTAFDQLLEDMLIVARMTGRSKVNYDKDFASRFKLGLQETYGGLLYSTRPATGGSRQRGYASLENPCPQP